MYEFELEIGHTEVTNGCSISNGQIRFSFADACLLVSFPNISSSAMLIRRRYTTPGTQAYYHPPFFRSCQKRTAMVFTHSPRPLHLTSPVLPAPARIPPKLVLPADKPSLERA